MTFAPLSRGSEAVRAADQAVMVQCPQHLRKQSPFFCSRKKAQKITEYRDTAPLRTSNFFEKVPSKSM